MKDLSLIHIVILIISGLLVGFINTLAGGASSISLNVFMFLGMSPLQASIANRIPVLFQTLTSTAVFLKHKMIDVKKSLIFASPLLVGAVLGALMAVEVDKKYFNMALAVMLIVVVFFLLYKPDRWIKGKEKEHLKGLNWLNGIIFFLMGVYAGFIYIGMGYFLIITFVLLIGYDLTKANANKNFVVLLYTPILLIVFALKGEFNIKMIVFGLVHSIGNVIGAYLATKIALKKGAVFIRYIMIGVSILTALQIFGAIKLY
jgi:uncharacterized membrane protein YfcA